MVFADHYFPSDFGWVNMDELSLRSSKSWWERFPGALGGDAAIIDRGGQSVQRRDRSQDTNDGVWASSASRRARVARSLPLIFRNPFYSVCIVWELCAGESFMDDDARNSNHRNGFSLPTDDELENSWLDVARLFDFCTTLVSCCTPVDQWERSDFSSAIYRRSI